MINNHQFKVKKMEGIILRTEGKVVVRCNRVAIMQDFTFPVQHNGTITYGSAFLKTLPNSDGTLIEIKWFANGEADVKVIISRFLELQAEMLKKQQILIENQLI